MSKMAANQPLDSVEQVLRMRRNCRQVAIGILIGVVLYVLLLALGLIPSAHPEATDQGSGGHFEEASHPTEQYVPPVLAVLPFAALLLAIAVLPLLRLTKHWWHSNRNRFLLAVLLGLLTLLFYGAAHPGGLANHFTHHQASAPGWETISAVFSNAIFSEFVPFIILLFSLYVISGGINLRGDLPAHPLVNCAFIGMGTVLASFIGTTGAAMVLIRPLLSTNVERRYKVHTVVFFIFMVCNCGGLLLPIGDPPLFLGYLRGVPFTWTLKLWPYWLGLNLVLLFVYYVWDRILYSREPIRGIVKDEAMIQPLRLTGQTNFLLIFGVVLCVAFVVPGKPFLGTGFNPPNYLREMLMLLLVVVSLLFTKTEARLWNRFDYHAIIEVAALFSGIFVCMQVPIEILQVKGQDLGVASSVSFFWATGILSSFLDNAPTYVVFFETATAISTDAAASVVTLSGGRTILEAFLVPISLGAVFMGANTYIGNGPNFMVKSIAEQTGVRMPSFFGYMFYSCAILVPLFVGVAFFL
jgi:Na+/H+ antiporter NhaD/arsenite permease-like protein